MENVVTALQSVTQKTVRQQQTLAMEEINCHHNYVQKEQHFGEEIYVTRKGAVSARAGQYGIIPVRWERKALSSVGWEMKSRSVRAATVPGG